MSEPRRCPVCGSDIPAGTPEGLCPKCLLQAGLESQPSQATAPFSPSKGFVPATVESLAPCFPQLEILEFLGSGGMGAVYKARQPGLDRLVALKILPPEVGADPAFAERFTREARALAKLNHPNIVAVYDFGQVQPSSFSREPSASAEAALAEGSRLNEQGLFYFLMEYVDGVNLRQAMRQGNLQPAEALKIVPQICDALQFAHDEGIVHRDIKPENILLDKRGRVKIADFGLAKLLGAQTDLRLTGTRQVMGTPMYMAPEQIQGARDVDHRADIYSLGVTFYEMLTGELPLGRFAPPSKKVEIDVRLDEVVLRALEVEPEQRYQHASEVKTDVEQIASGPGQAPATLKRYSSRQALERVIADLLPEDKPAAVRIYREATGASLAEAMSAVKAIAVKFNKDKPVDFAVDSFIWALVWAIGAVLFGFWLAQTQTSSANQLMFRFGGIILGAFWIAHNISWQRRRSGWHLKDLQEEIQEAEEEEEEEEGEEEEEEEKKEKQGEKPVPPKTKRIDPERTRSLLQRTAEGIWLLAALFLASGAGVLAWIAVMEGGFQAQPLESNWGALLVIGTTYLVSGPLLALAGLFARWLRLRVTTLILSALAGLFVPAALTLIFLSYPRFDTWPAMGSMWLGMPFALWTGYLLLREDVRQLFDSQAPIPTTTKLRIAKWLLGLLFVTCAILSSLHETSRSNGVATSRVVGYLYDPWLRIDLVQEQWEIRWASWGMAILALALVSLATLLWVHFGQRGIIWLLVIGLVVAVLAAAGYVLFSASERQGVSQPAVKHVP